jgi:glycosyltransferase involved in cell wall biosynthesis
MRICQITGDYAPKICGVGSYTALLSDSLAKTGAEVIVVTSAYNQTASVSEPGKVGVKPVMAGWQLGDSKTLLDQIEAIQPDVVHLQYQIATFQDAGMIYTLPFELRRRGYPLVTTFHDYAGPKGLGKMGAALSLLLLFGSNKIVVTHDKPRLTFEKIGLLRQKLAQLPVGSNIPLAEAPSPGYSLIRHDEPVLTYFGFVWRGKNIECLMQLQRRMLDEHIPTQLLIIGEITDNGYYQELQSLANNLGIVDRVHFTGAQDEASVSGLLRQSTLCIFPYSKGATTGHGTLIAAIQHGIPVVTTVDPAIKLSHFEDRRNIMLAPVGDPDALEQTVKELLQEVTLRDTIRQNARMLVRVFSWEQIAECHLQLYQSLQ